MSSIFVVIGWYVTGFLVARALIDHGHSPMMWWVAAALLGAMVTLPAVIATIWAHRVPVALDLVERSPSPSSVMHVVAVAPIDRLEGAVDAIPTPVGRRTDLVTVVGTVGYEAFSHAVETGERAHAAASMRSLIRPCSITDNRIVTTEGPRQLAAVFDEVGVPDIVVLGTRPGRIPTRRAFERSLELSAAHDVPVLITPWNRSPTPAATRELSLSP
ncbi:hypothetical protein [Actinospongicola halichondriae]|uniref:hypothetical protein n=1 Tax=Actinospongicola halichondriae TaxID=3236844 RepID=UPI003D3C8480